MFSRSTAPAACVSGSDSIGRHTRCCSMRVSAWAGVSMRVASHAPRGAEASGGLLLRGGLRLVSAQLLVETIGHVGDLVDGGVVLLVLHFFHLRFLLRSRIGLSGDLRVVLIFD